MTSNGNGFDLPISERFAEQLDAAGDELAALGDRELTEGEAAIARFVTALYTATADAVIALETQLRAAGIAAPSTASDSPLRQFMRDRGIGGD